MAHFNSHVSSQIARKNAAQRTDRQTDLRSVFSTKPQNIFALNDRVLLKAKRRHFQKYNPIDFPAFDPGVFTISAVHDKTWPILYSLREIDARRKFYGFELTKLDASFDRVAKQQKERTDSLRDRIVVEDVIRGEPTRLRSGRILENGREQVKYKINRHGKTDIVDAPGLKLWIRALGEGAVQYDEKQFSPPSWKAAYKI